MTPVPLSLPFRASDANELANLVFELAERRPLTDEVRNRVAARVAALRLESIRPHMGSLSRDPVHHSTYYVAVDTASENPPQLLHMALSTAPTSSIFHKPLLVGRMRRPNGPEIVINTIPFGPDDTEALEKYISRIDTGILPRALGARPTLITPPSAAAFDAFRTFFKRTGRNLAGIEMPAPEFNLGLWTAARAGWRDGYSAGVVLAAEKNDRDAVRDVARFTRFRVETAMMVREAVPAADADARFEREIGAEERIWILDQFSSAFEIDGTSLEFSSSEIAAATLRFHDALKSCERIHEWIREARSALKMPKAFDFELALPPVTTKELAFCLHWLKSSEHAAQLVASGSGELAGTAAVARYFGCLPVVDSRANSTDAELESISRTAAGRLSYRVIGGPDDPAEYKTHLLHIADALFA